MDKRGGSAHNGCTSTFNGAGGQASWLSDGLVIATVPEIYNGWNDPRP